MLKKILVLLALHALFIPNIILADQPDFVRESVVIFKFKVDATPAELQKFNALVNPGTILEVEEIEGVAFVVKLRDIKGLEKAFAQQLMITGAVEFAEPDALVPHAVIPDDPYYADQWHHAMIDSPAAWDHVTGPDDLNAVKVCVLDTGVDTDHPDLVDNLLLPGYNARLEVDGSVEDVHGHGTSTSGVVGASGNNWQGVAGMAWDINIIPVQINISDADSSAYISDMAVGIRWCASQGVKVANLSYGGAQYSTIDSAAQVLRDSGGLLFMSAGNDGTYNPVDAYPDYSSFVIVGATSSSDVITWFSETGPFVDVAAPGASIYSTSLGGGYSYVSGTSFSSPMTAGLGALIYSVNPDFTPAEVENYIFSTAVDLGDAGDDDVYGHGRIDAGSAVAAAVDHSLPNDPPVALASADIAGGIVPLDVNFNDAGSYDPDGSIVSYVWDFGDGNTATGPDVAHTYTSVGTFDATLTVTDNRAAQSTSTPIVITVEPDPYQMDPPSNLTATVDTNNVTLNWTHDLSNVDGFEIHRAQKVRGKYAYAPIDTVLQLKEYVDGGLELGTYRYKVRAYRSDLDGPVYTDFSNEAAAKVDTTSDEPEPDPGTLSAPELSASNDGFTVTLTWAHDCPTGPCTYFIKRGDAKVRGAINFADLTAVSDGFAHTVNEPGSGTYYYKVHAVRGSDISPDSNTVTVRLK